MGELTKEDVGALTDGVLDMMMAFSLQSNKTAALRQLCEKAVKLESEREQTNAQIRVLCEMVQHYMRREQVSPYSLKVIKELAEKEANKRLGITEVDNG